MQFLTDAIFYRCSTLYVNETLCCWFVPYWGSPSWRNSPIDEGWSLPCLMVFSPQTTVYASWHWIKLWRSVMWCMLMVNVNFWPICRTYSLSVFISWCSYYHYLSLHHDSFWVPVEPHCAKYYRNTSLAFLVWLHSSRSAIFMDLLPCYSNFFPFNKWDI